MPPLVLPAGVPLGLGWYVLWISIHGLLIFIFRLLGAPHSHLQQNVHKEAERRLPSLNEYLWRLVNESSSDPYDGPLASADHLTKLLIRARDANKPITKYNRLRRHTGLGKLAGCSAIVGALICGGLYLFKYPSIETASIISIAGFSLFTIWAFWHIIHSMVYYYLTLRVSNEED